MKKTGRFLSLLLAFCVLFVSQAAASSTQSTGYTVTLSITGREEIAQDGYLPSRLYMGLELNKAQDLFIANDILYIADTGNKRVLAVDIDSGDTTIIGQKILKQPTGVAADSQGRIYVADSKNREAYRFSADGTLEQVFARPTTPNFGTNEKYIPTKIAAADNGGCYIVSEGTSAGVIFMSGNGDFLGYFSSNRVNKTLYDWFVDLVFNETQKAKLSSAQAASFANIFRGEDGLVYTSNKGEESRIKKNSINGVDMLEHNENMPVLSRLTDICVADDGRIIAVNQSGYITEISFDGYLLCKFGGPSGGTDRVGLFSSPTGIGVDSQDNIYVLDSASNYVQVFTPTLVQARIHTAMNYYNDGKYDESIAVLNDVMKHNNSSYFAHLYLGLNYMQKMEYTLAKEHFHTANNKVQYSEAYWEERNEWLQNNLMYVLIGLAALAVVITVLMQLNKKRHIFQNIRMIQEKGKNKYKLYADLCQLPYAFRHPIDHAYNVRKNLTGTYLSATVLYGMGFVLIVLFQVASGFIYATDPRNFSFLNTFLLYFGTLTLFLISHFFICSINDGEGTFRASYISFAYCLTPVLFVLPWLILFANFATMDESYLIYAVLAVSVSLTIVYMFLSITEVQQYSFKQTVFNIFATLFFMAVMIFALSIVYLLTKQVVDFVSSIIAEVTLRA